MGNIPINSGTGPNVAVDAVGTSNYQVVKIAQGGAGSTDALASYLVVSHSGTADVAITNTAAVTLVGTAPVSFAGTANVAVVNTAAVTIASTAPVSFAGTANVAIVGNVPCYPVASPTKVRGSAVSTTSGAAFILITSGAHTLYITDLLVSAAVPMSVSIRSATTQVSSVFLAANGGFVQPMITPMVLNSNQSLTVLQSASGSCSAYAAGYTVT